MNDEYNEYMGGVDKLDQLISTYSFTKNKKSGGKGFLFFNSNFCHQHCT